MDKYNKIFGSFGEQAAEYFLKKNGYKILERNYNCRFGELDIIAVDDKCIVFVEVKTRSSSKYGSPSLAVNYWKQRHLQLSARYYIDVKHLNNYSARFDVVEVFAKFADNIFIVNKINIIKNAF